MSLSQRRTYFRHTARFLILVMTAQLFVGCKSKECVDCAPGNWRNFAPLTKIEVPDVSSCNYEDNVQTMPPITLEDLDKIEYWDLTLEEATHIALKNSKVLRDLGGLVLNSPDNVQTVFDPSVTESDPRFGVEAALSEFDANWSTGAFFEKNDRALNNQFFGGGTRLLKQDLFEYSSELSKRSATGTLFSVRNNIDYDFNNAPGNFFMNGAWDVNVETEARQPLLQGNGVEFNRIAGPGGTEGVYNGVMIARISTDISLADFEMGVRNLISDIESTYWELYFGYRDLDAKIRSRDQALETWRTISTLYQTGQLRAAQEAQARAQYYRQKEEVQNALTGRLQERTRSTIFRGNGGVYNNERQLRLLIGLPINDGRLIRPADEPILADVEFDWDEALIEGLMRRPELRRQKWVIKQQELELIAAKNFLLPRLDAVGRYRWRGFGHRLIEDRGDNPRFNNAVANLVSGDFQEWQAGLELTFPVGFRKAHAAVRNAQLEIARERAILDEQQRSVIHDLSNAISEKDRAYLTAQSNFDRRFAASEQLKSLRAIIEDSDADENERIRLLDLILDAQRRLADAESKFFRSMSEYMLAIKGVHYAKGSLLDYNEIYLSEGPWVGKAYDDAARKERLRRHAWRLEDYVMQRPSNVSGGTYAQQLEAGYPGDYPLERLPKTEILDTPDNGIPKPEMDDDKVSAGDENGEESMIRVVTPAVNDDDQVATTNHEQDSKKSRTEAPNSGFSLSRFVKIPAINPFSGRPNQELADQSKSQDSQTDEPANKSEQMFSDKEPEKGQVAPTLRPGDKQVVRPVTTQNSSASTPATTGITYDHSAPTSSGQTNASHQPKVSTGLVVPVQPVKTTAPPLSRTKYRVGGPAPKPAAVTTPDAPATTPGRPTSSTVQREAAGILFHLGE